MERPASTAGKRLKVRRIFTLGTPHRGAILADRIALDSAARDLRPGSEFLHRLDEALPHAGYELLCYAHTNDRTGPGRAERPYSEWPALMSPDSCRLPIHVSPRQNVKFHLTPLIAHLPTLLLQGAGASACLSIDRNAAVRALRP